MPSSRACRNLAYAVLLAAAAGLGSPDVQADGFYEGKGQGWYFYDDGRTSPASTVSASEPAPASSAQVAAPPAAASNQAKPEPFSVEWLRQKIKILQLNSMNHPTVENLEAFMWAQRMMLDMSQNFADVGSKVAADDPYLNEAVRFPTAAAARSNALWQVDRARDEILKNLSARAGLWFFFDSRCAFCAQELPVVKGIAERYHFPLQLISEDGAPLQGMARAAMVVDRGHGTFKAFELKLTPAVVLVVPPSTVMVVAHGAMAQDELQRKIVEAAIDGQLVPHDLMDIAQLEKRGIVSPGDIERMRAQAAAADTDDPQQLVKLMRDAVGRHMPDLTQNSLDH
ncbi:conjugal transfer protein TraF [Paraburkholderia xenovorans]|jgi:conjugal transfer pilus assembly protein TraF